MKNRDDPLDRPLAEMKAALEALIFVSDDPISLAEAASAMGVAEGDLREVVDELRSDYDTGGRGLRIEEVAGGLRLSTRREVAPILLRLSRLRHRRRLSPAALETLAVIAYRQPITAPEIQDIRGVNPEGALKTLLERRLVRISGRKKVVGRPLLYGTTRQFLMHFGLNSTEDLPPIEEFERVLASGSAAEGSEHTSSSAGASGEKEMVSQEGIVFFDDLDDDDGGAPSKAARSDGAVLGTGTEE